MSLYLQEPCFKLGDIDNQTFFKQCCLINHFVDQKFNTSYLLTKHYMYVFEQSQLLTAPLYNPNVYRLSLKIKLATLSVELLW